VGRWIPIFRAITHSHTYEVENYPATQTLHEFFGFIPPLPVPTKHPSPINLAADQLHCFATTVGMKSLDSEFEKSTVMQYCWEFVHSFKSGSMPPSELYDLAVGNRICILGTTHFQFLRWMKLERWQFVLTGVTVRGTPYASDARPSSASASDSRLPSAPAPATSSLFRNAYGRMTSYSTRFQPASAPDRVMSRDVA